MPDPDSIPAAPLLLVNSEAERVINEALNQLNEPDDDTLQLCSELFDQRQCILDTLVLAEVITNADNKKLKTETGHVEFVRQLLALIGTNNQNVSIDLRKFVQVLLDLNSSDVDSFALQLDALYFAHYKRLTGIRKEMNVTNYQPRLSSKQLKDKYAQLHPLEEQFPLPSASRWPSDFSDNGYAQLCTSYYMEATHPEVMGKIIDGKAYDTSRRGKDFTYNGLCLIVNVHNYRAGPPRDGSEEDVKGIKLLFGRKFRMQVEVHADLTADEFLQLLSRMHKATEEEYKDNSLSSLVVFIMAHGAEGILYMTDTDGKGNGELSIEYDIKSNIGGLKLFKDKPKIVFIQACQVNTKSATAVKTKEKQDALHKLDAVPHVEASLKATSQSWMKKDMFVFMATTPSDVAYRCPGWGTTFIQCVLQALKCQAHFRELDDLKKQVRKLMKRWKLDEQVSPSTDTLRRAFYFYCPLHLEIEKPNN